MSLAEELIEHWAPVLIGVNLKTGDKGCFTVTCNGAVIFDKKSEGRHAHPGEIVERLAPLVGPRLAWR